MDFPLIYLFQRAGYRLYRFIYDWYVGGLLFFWHHTLEILESQDRFWALRITLKNIFEPLYQDETVLGRVLGFIFRSFRIIIALSIYTLIILCSALAYLAFAALPIYIIYSGLTGSHP